MVKVTNAQTSANSSWVQQMSGDCCCYR